MRRVFIANLYRVLSPLHTGDWKPAFQQQEHARMPSALCHAAPPPSHLNQCAVIMSVTHDVPVSSKGMQNAYMIASQVSIARLLPLGF